MALQIVHILRCLNLVFIVWMYVDKTNSISLSDLKIICAVDKGTNSIQSLGDACQYCTAISSFGTHQTNKTAIEILRGKLPYLKVYNYDDYKTMKKHIHSKDAMTSFIDKLEKMIKEEKIDAIAFYNFASGQRYKNYNKGRQIKIRDFFNMAKERLPNVMFGLLIVRLYVIIDNAFDPSVLKDAVQFYIVQSTSYEVCTRASHQKDMANTSPVEDMNNTLIMLKELKYDLSTVILTIRIVVNNVMHLDASKKYDASYTTHCSRNLPKWAKYCSESLEGFYAKGSLVCRYNMIGAFMKYVDDDDFGNKCECGAFAALRVITAGVNQTPKESCPTWGLLPRDRAKINGTKN